MNPRQKMNEKEIHDYNMRLIQHNFDKFDKLEDLSMHKIFTVKEKDTNNRPIRNKYTVDWKYKEITARAKAFDDWKHLLERYRMRVKNKEENPAAIAATNSFLECILCSFFYMVSHTERARQTRRFSSATIEGGYRRTIPR